MVTWHVNACSTFFVLLSDRDRQADVKLMKNDHFKGERKTFLEASTT